MGIPIKNLFVDYPPPPVIPSPVPGVPLAPL